MLSKATQGTGQWLLISKDYLLWLDPNGNLKILWGSGIPGAGKSVIASIVAHDLENRATASGGSICVAYVFFRHGDSSSLTVRGILEVLVKQIVERHPDCAVLAGQVYTRHAQEGTQPSEAEILQLLARFAQAKSVTYYVLDALDESPEPLRVSLIKYLASLNVRLFVTSRPLKDVENRFPNVCSFPIAAQDDDLNLHIDQMITRSAVLEEIFAEAEEPFKRDVVSLVKENSGGMFLHASLQLDAISRCRSTQDIIETLSGFPSEVEAVYRQTWRRICHYSAKDAMLSKTALIWVLNATRPITVEELRRAIAASPDAHHFKRERLVPAATLLTLCCGLLVVEEETKLVRLFHDTARGTLGKLLAQEFPSPNSLLAAVCMRHLVYCGFQNTTLTSEEEYIAALQRDPLLSYAAHAWITHAQECLDVPDIHLQVTDFISKCKAFPTYSSPRGPFDFDLFGPLHMAASHHIPLARLPDEQLGDLNVTTKITKVTPLMVASRYGNIGMVQDLLHSPYIQVNLGDMDGTTSLMDAVDEGHESIVEMFLARPEIEVNTTDDYGRAPLASSAQLGHEGIVSMLLARQDIDVNLVNSDGWPALVLAIRKGQRRIVGLLLAHPQINVNWTSSAGWTPLIEAASRGMADVVKLLLENSGIDINLAGGKPATPALVWAAHNGHTRIVELLLTRPELQVNEMGSSGWPALMCAIFNNHEAIVQLLLSHPEINVNWSKSADHPGLTPLMEAAQRGLKSVTKLLLEHPDININLVGGKSGMSALARAVEKGHKSVVRCLLARPEIEVNIAGGTGLPALMCAISNRRGSIVRLLVSHPQINVNWAKNPTQLGWTPLMQAVQGDFESGVKCLLGHPDIDITLVDGKWGMSAISLAAYYGHEGILGVLLARSATLVNALTLETMSRSALILAAWNGHEAALALLLTHAGITTVDFISSSGYSPLMLAEQGGHDGCARRLRAFSISRIETVDDLDISLEEVLHIIDREVEEL